MSADGAGDLEGRVLARTRLPGRPVLVLVERPAGERVLAKLAEGLDTAIGDHGHLEPDAGGFTFHPANPVERVDPGAPG